MKTECEWCDLEGPLFLVDGEYICESCLISEIARLRNILKNGSEI